MGCSCQLLVGFVVHAGWTNRLWGICCHDEKGQWRDRKANHEKNTEFQRCSGLSWQWRIQSSYWWSPLVFILWEKNWQKNNFVNLNIVLSLTNFSTIISRLIFGEVFVPSLDEFDIGKAEHAWYSISSHENLKMAHTTNCSFLIMLHARLSFWMLPSP